MNMNLHSTRTPHDDAYFGSPKAPSLSHERKVRMQKYVETRARSCLDLLRDHNHMLWKLHDTKGDVAVFKQSSEWSEFTSAKATVRATASFPTVLKTLYDLKTADKFKMFLRRVIGETFLDADVLEDLNSVGVYPHTNNVPVLEAREVYKQASIKWWAIKSGPLVSKSSDFYVLEYIGIETTDHTVTACYLYQESLAEVGGMPSIQDNNLERAHIESLLCKFEQLSTHDMEEERVIISVLFQRRPPLVSLFRSNPATDMATHFARGLCGLFEDPDNEEGMPPVMSIVKISTWIQDHERQYCVICTRKFSLVFRRRHHCRTCGEVICWQCSRTVRVPSISFTHNDTGRQVLSRHQSSIRVCRSCVQRQQRAASDVSENQLDEASGYSEGDVHQQRGPQEGQEQQKQVYDHDKHVVEPNESLHEHNQLPLLSTSPSHQQASPPLLPYRRDSQHGSSRSNSYLQLHDSSSESYSERLPSKDDAVGSHSSLYDAGEEEAKEEKDYVDVEGDEEILHHRYMSENVYNDFRRASVASSTVSTRHPTAPEQHIQPPLPQEQLYAERKSEQKSEHHEPLLLHRKLPPSLIAPLHRSTAQASNLMGPRHPSNQSNRSHRSQSAIGPTTEHSSFSLSANSRDQSRHSVMAQSIDPAASLTYHLDTNRPSVPQPHSSYEVHAGSSWAAGTTESQAMMDAFYKLLTKLGGDVHFMVIGFSTSFSANKIVNVLAQLAPGVPYIGGTIARGMCDESSWVSVHRHPGQGMVTLWGVNDPHGLYTIVHAEYAQSDAREKTYAATKTALARVAVDIDPQEKPAFVAVYACPLFVESAIDGIREAVHCPIIGGCSSDASKREASSSGRSSTSHASTQHEMSVSWMQISSGSSTDYTKRARDGRGDSTETGIAFALCYPSVETSVAWFSGYSPVGVDSEFCMGTVTKASNKMIYEIDCKPAADVYKEWLEVAATNSDNDLSNVSFPRLGNLHPLGTTLDLHAMHRHHRSRGPSIDESNAAASAASLYSLASTDWSRLINMTAVITGINEDGSLSTTSSIAPGTNVVMMESSTMSLRSAIPKMGDQATISERFTVDETIGCLMFLSAGVQALLGHKSMAEMVGAFREWAPGACLMGMTTFGEIGHLPESHDFPHYDSLMFGAIIFSKKKRKEYLVYY